MKPQKKDGGRAVWSSLQGYGEITSAHQGGRERWEAGEEIMLCPLTGTHRAPLTLSVSMQSHAAKLANRNHE